MKKIPSSSRLKALLLFLASTLVVSLIIVFFGILFLSARWNDSISNAEIQSRNLAHSIEQNLSSTLREIDFALSTVVGELERSAEAGHLDLPRLSRFLATEEHLLPDAVAIRVTDAQGRVILGNPHKDRFANYADRPYFALLQTRPRSDMIISKPLMGLLTRMWVIPCAKRYNLPDGRFGGTVVIPVFVDHFQEVLSKFNVGSGGTISLRDGDGGFITRYPLPETGITLKEGDQTGSVELHNFMRSDQREETHFSRAPFDHVSRIYTTVRIANAPLIIGVGLAEVDYLAQWRRDCTRTIAMIGASLLGVWGLAGLLWKAWENHFRATEALAEREERYRTLISRASEGILIHTLEGTPLEMNESFAHMHGYTLGEMLHMNLKDLNVPGTFRKHPERLQRILAGETLTFEVQHVHKDGHVVLLEVLAGLVSTGELPVLLAFHRDITQRKQEEEEKLELVAQLQQAQKMESLGTLAGGIAHDMNNILGAILGLASSNIDAQTPGSRAHRAFDTISKAAIRGGEMIKSLLNFARKSPTEERELDINAILREEVHLLERTTFSLIQLEMDLDPGLRSIRGDGSTLANAFMNLCVNSVHAMPEHGMLTIRTRNVDPGWVEVMVKDTGMGMSKEILSRALDPFFTTKEVGKGTGLGLSMVYSTVRAHQGQMDIQSQPGKGTVVKLLFPTGTGMSPVTESAVEHRSPAILHSLEVLLVDDDELIRTSTQAVLEALGHHATTLSNGEEALEKIRSGDVFDVVILDLNMPGLGGARTLQFLRGLRQELPVLLATGRVDQVAVDLAEAHPNVTLLSKPYSMKDLQGKLESIKPGLTHSSLPWHHIGADWF